MRFGLTIFFSDFIFISSTHNRWVIVSSLDTFMRFMVKLWNVDRLLTNRDKCQRRGAKCKVPLSLAKAPQQKWSCTKSWRHPFWGERFSCKMLTLIDFLKLEQMWTNRWGEKRWHVFLGCEVQLWKELLQSPIRPPPPSPPSSLSPHQTFTFSTTHYDRGG